MMLSEYSNGSSEDQSSTTNAATGGEAAPSPNAKEAARRRNSLLSDHGDLNDPVPCSPASISAGCISCIPYPTTGKLDFFTPVLNESDDFHASVMSYISSSPKSQSTDSATASDPSLTSGPNAESLRKRGTITLKEAEAIERGQILSIFQRYWNTVHWNVMHERERLGISAFQFTVLHDQFEQGFVDVQLRKMRQYFDLHFNDVFPNGLAASSLSAEDLLYLGSCLINLENMLAPDLMSCAFAGIPGFKFRADTIPKIFLPDFYSFMAAKSAMQMNTDTSPEEWRILLLSYFADKEGAAMLPSQRYALELMVRSLAADFNSPFRSSSVAVMVAESTQALYDFLQAKDAEIHRTMQGDHDLNTIPFDYQKGELVGRGGFGAVYRCINVKNGVFHALKELPWSGDPQKERQIRLEIDTLKRLSHENIIKYYGCRFDREKKKVSILMEFAARNLRDMAVECHGLAKPLLIHYCRKILQGLAYLHDQGIIHRDIKAANILVTTSGEVKLSDFGSASLFTPHQSEGTILVEHAHNRSESPIGLVPTSSTHGAQDGKGSGSGDRMLGQPIRHGSPMGVDGGGAGVGVGLDQSAVSQSLEPPGNITETKTTDSAYTIRLQEQLRKRQLQNKRQMLVGTPLFMAPEILRGALPSEATDIWAFGCTLIELVSGKYPWQELVDAKASREMIFRAIGSATKPPSLPAGLSVSQEFKDFFLSCLAMDPTLRPSAKALLKSPFLNPNGGLMDRALALSQSALNSTLSSQRSSDLSSAGLGEPHLFPMRHAAQSPRNPFTPPPHPRNSVLPMLLESKESDLVPVLGQNGEDGPSYGRAELGNSRERPEFVPHGTYHAEFDVTDSVMADRPNRPDAPVPGAGTGTDSVDSALLMTANLQFPARNSEHP